MTETAVPYLLFSLSSILFLAIFLGKVFSYFGQPRVVGEIAAGLLLGGSLLGHIYPNVYIFFFDSFPNQKDYLSIFYWFGLILLMFIAGFKVPQKLNLNDSKIVVLLVLGGTLLPLSFGFVMSNLIQAHMGIMASHLSFSVIVSVACAVTSIPVLTSIFSELNILETSFVKRILTSAAIQDLFLWAILSVFMVDSTNAQNSWISINIILNVVVTISFTLFAIKIIPKFLKLISYRLKWLTEPALSFTLIICFVVTGLASLIKINIVFSALVAGLIVGSFKSEKMTKVKVLITDFSLCFFIPIYFGLVGMSINLHNDLNLNLILGFLLITSFVKIVSNMIFLSFAGFNMISSFDYALTMNARGGPGIVLASMAYKLNYVDAELFVALVLTSIATSLFTGVWLKLRKKELI